MTTREEGELRLGTRGSSSSQGRGWGAMAQGSHRGVTGQSLQGPCSPCIDFHITLTAAALLTAPAVSPSQPLFGKLCVQEAPAIFGRWKVYSAEYTTACYDIFVFQIPTSGEDGWSPLTGRSTRCLASHYGGHTSHRLHCTLLPPVHCHSRLHPRP